MLSRFGAEPFAVGGALLVAALGMANVGLLAMAAIPLLLILLAVLLPAPRLEDSLVETSQRRIFAGHEVQVNVRARLRPGWGPIDLHVKLPAPFRVTRGSNLHHAWATPALREIAYEFSVACDRRGVYEVPALNYESGHATLLGAAGRGQAGQGAVLRVEPRWNRLRRLRQPRTRSKSMLPELDLSQTGVQTTEFQDIREYMWGDPPKSVNWKASAKYGEMGEQLNLLVNEYEREGKKIIWVFLDAGQQGLIGTSTDNAFERRVEAAYAIALHYIEKGYTLGFSLYNYAGDYSLYPETSSKQKRRIIELLNQLGPTQEARTLQDAVEHAKRYIRRNKTLAFVVASLGWSIETLEPGLRRVRRAVGHRRGRIPVVLVHVNPFGLVPYAAENGLARVTSLLQQGSLRAVGRLGIHGIEWDPSRSSLGSLLRRVAP